MRNNHFLSRYIGDKAFYRRLLAIVLPMMLQNGLTNFVSLLDNIMVGAVGTDQMNGVSIVNQLLFVYNLCIFGGLSGAGIFGAQYYGKGDHEGVRNTFRFKILLSTVLLVGGVAVFLLLGDTMMAQFLHEGSQTGNIEATASFGREYLLVMLWGLLPFALKECYASTLRETGETLLPMKAGIVAILVNLVFNYILIFGHFGAPQLGVAGAAIATVISRYVECAIVVWWTHRHQDRARFISGAYKSMRVPSALAQQIIYRGMPILANEFLWSSGMTMLTQCYSTRGLAVVAAQNICSTIANFFNVVWLSMGNAVSIIVGQQLGANEFEKAKESVRRIMFFSVCGALVVTLMLLCVSPIFPHMYNTTVEVRELATSMLIIVAIAAPLHAFTHATYFTLRSGGKTWITFLFDCVFLWVVNIPAARLLTGGTDWGILPIYAVCQYIDILKCLLGFWMVRKGLWINNIVDEK